jgi:hypothetical protein
LADSEREHDRVRAEHDAPRNPADAIECRTVAETTWLTVARKFLHVVELSSQLGAGLETALECDEPKV